MTRALTRRSLLAGGLATAGLAGCSIAGDDSPSGSSSGGTTVTVRLWDDTVQPAYEKSFAAFREKNPGIVPKIEMVPWASYWDKLPADVAGGTLPDVLWVNSSNFGVYVDAGAFLNIGEELPDAVGGWQRTVVDQYTRDGSLWGVPQLSDAIALFCNTDLTQAAGVDPSNLVWNPSGAGDTFLPAAKALTSTAGARTQYGFNAAYDLQAIFYDFVGSNGGRWQDDDDSYVFGDDAKSVEAMQYVVDLINRDRVSPSAADTNDNGDFSRDQFTQGNMALFQSGTYNLKNVADAAQFSWTVAPGLTGPAGRVLVTNGIVAVGNAKTKDKDATLKVLEWLGSAEGAGYVGAEGAAFPAVTAAQQGYLEHWKSQDVDVQPFLDAAAATEVVPAPHGARAQTGQAAADEVLKEVFLGRIPVPAGMKQAQDAANAAIAG
jgi:multiple sugar transport system substrate-binding protein